MANRSRPTHARSYGGGGGGGLGAILGALVGAPGLEGGETIEAQGPPTASGQYPTNTTPYSMGKPTLAQKIFNPRGVAASQQMGDMLKFEDYQNQLKSGLISQTGENQKALEDARIAGNIQEKQAADQIEKEKFAREVLHLPDWNTAQQVLSHPDVQTAALKALYDLNEKQGFENQLNAAKAREADANAISTEFKPIPENGSIYNARTGLTITSRGPLQFEPAKGYEGGIGASRLPVSGGGSRGGSFVAKPGGVAAEIGSFNQSPNDTYTGDDISNIGDVFSPYIPQKTGVLPIDKNTPKLAPISSTSTGLRNSIKGFIQDKYVKPTEQAVSFIKGMASTPLPANLPIDTGRFQADFVDPLKGILNSVIGTSPVPTPNPNAYEDYTNPSPVPPSLRPVVQPPSILEEMRRRRQLLFPQPLAQPYYGR